MSFPTLTLDDRAFQEIVNEARRRVAHRCPEWTEHNVSDPGMTLIETFAWMTEMIVYRLNRVPEKLHLALLELLGIELAPPLAAQADLRFLLAAPATAPVRIPGGETEVTSPGGDDGEVVFRVGEDFTIEPTRPAAYVLQRSGELDEVAVADGVTRPGAANQPAFSTPPAVGDALYLGFQRSLDRLVVRVVVTGSRARGVGVNPKAPPLRWEASSGAAWVPAEVLEDTTGGFNEAGGTIELQLPMRTSATTFAGHHLHWLRCSVTELTPVGLPSPRYTDPPRIQEISADAVGALVRAEHSALEVAEELGESDGTPGQRFGVRYPPALALRDGEGLEVLGDDGDWESWERVDSFDASDAHDQHYRFDAAAGEVELGPAIRTQGHGWRQLGRIPPKGTRLRMSRYRHGGGAHGSVARSTLRQLRNPIPGIASVTNPDHARGGVDGESIAVARRRAALELRTRYRAVTAEDFEFLAGEVPAGVGRARCRDLGAGTAVPVYVMPAVHDPARPLGYEELTADERLLEDVAAYLDARRLVGTSVDVQRVPLRGVTVAVDAETTTAARPEAVEREIAAALYRFLNPLVGGNPNGMGEGWEFGRPLNEGEVYALVQDVPGVERVRMVGMYETDPRTPGSPRPQPAGAQIRLEPDEVLCSATHRVRATRRDAR